MYLVCRLWVFPASLQVPRVRDCIFNIEVGRSVKQFHRVNFWTGKWLILYKISEDHGGRCSVCIAHCTVKCNACLECPSDDTRPTMHRVTVHTYSGAKWASGTERHTSTEQNVPIIFGSCGRWKLQKLWCIDGRNPCSQKLLETEVLLNSSFCPAGPYFCYWNARIMWSTHRHRRWYNRERRRRCGVAVTMEARYTALVHVWSIISTPLMLTRGTATGAPAYPGIYSSASRSRTGRYCRNLRATPTKLLSSYFSVLSQPFINHMKAPARRLHHTTMSVPPSVNLLSIGLPYIKNIYTNAWRMRFFYRKWRHRGNPPLPVWKCDSSTFHTAETSS